MKFRRVDHRYLDYPMIIDFYLDLYMAAFKRLTRPTITLRISNRNTKSSGRTWGRCKIVITAGSDEQDFIHVLAHELSHCLAPYASKHDDRFYEWFLKVARKFKLDMDYFFSREMAYKPREVKRLARKHRVQLIRVDE